MTPRTLVRTAPRLALAAALLSVAGCGGAGFFEVGVGVGYGGTYGDPYYYEPAPLLAGVALDNRTDATTFEAVVGFAMAPAATGAWSGDLLLAPLPPGAVADLGDLPADVYDAEAALELGGLVSWWDVPVPAGEVTTFEVW